MVVVLLASHLICVNVASVAPLVAVWFERREASGVAVAGVWGRSLMWQAVALLLLGVALGLVIGVLSWNADYLDAIRMLRSKVHFGVWEILFSLALMLVQVAWWQRSPAPARIPRLSRGLLALLASTNLLYHFPVLMVVFARLVSGDDLASVPLDAAAFRQRLVHPLPAPGK